MPIGLPPQLHYDPALLALALATLVATAIAAPRLLIHVRESSGTSRLLWAGTVGGALGCGAWASQTIATLGLFSAAHAPVHLGPLSVSAGAVLVLASGGLMVACSVRATEVVLGGGALLSAAFPVAYAASLRAVEAAGIVQAGVILTAFAGTMSVLVGMCAVALGLHSGARRWRFAVSILFAVSAVIAHGLPVGYGAVTLTSTEVRPHSVPSEWLAVNVAAVFFVALAAVVAAVAIDVLARRRNEMHADHMRGLANGAVEGLLLCRGQRIETANDSFVKLAGIPLDRLVGRGLDEHFPDPYALRLVASRHNTPVETNLQHADGALVPVEMISKPLDIHDVAHTVVAVRDLRARQAADEHIRHLAMHDSLTGLANRARFNAKLDEVVYEKRAVQTAVLLLDLDGFKEVNDLHGHAAGDGVLKDVADTVSRLLPYQGLLARLGGDEFAVMLPNIDDAVAEKFAGAVVKGVAGRNLHGVTASVGLAFHPRDGEDRESILRSADVAMYRAKEEGKSTWRRFESNMGFQARERRAIEHDLKQAVSGRQLELVFQPQQCLRTDRVNGFEALVRWIHPTRGYVDPGQFIPIAEETGAILGIGAWVLREACREAAGWEARLSIAVNVSAVQLYRQDFVDDLRAVLDETGLPSDRLELEITETAIIKDLNRAVATLRAVKALGVRIAMDDFGTGYSSLSNLLAFPFDKIKLDRSFVSTPDKQSATIIRAVLGIGKGLGLPVIAEGVETEDQVAFLRAEGCDEIQGYLVGRPAPISAFTDMVHPALGRRVVAFRAA